MSVEPVSGRPPAASAAPRRPVRSAKHQFASTMLVLEACVVGFATLVAFGLEAAEPRIVWTLGGALGLSLVLAAGLLRRPGGYVVGSVLQAAVVGAGVVVPLMFVVGAIFAALWFSALRLGARIDRERAERARAEAAEPGPDGR